MIDTHCHLLPYLDDGAASWEDSLAMAGLACRDGITSSIVTPHWTGAPGEVPELEARLGELRSRLAGAGIPLEMHAGQELLLVPGLLDALREGRALPLAGSSYLLLETARLDQSAFTHAALFRLQAHGYRIILAHPERVPGWQRRPGHVAELVSRGCHLQLNAGSLLGEFGGTARKTAERFLKRGWVSLLATDAHSPTERPPRLAGGVARGAGLIGEAAVRLLVEGNPARILADQPLPGVME